MTYLPRSFESMSRKRQLAYLRAEIKWESKGAGTGFLKSRSSRLSGLRKRLAQLLAEV